ncbi:Histidine kinase [Reichenbachiella agariperforans]|uniref:Histidine kinase n=1 Tax=Reichenbachiella agariperforans TaxID=156994 RepID=A0A1M6M7U6_REIAG|nr:histidine kinase [Reichenbachiella agariperforans]SHJ79333.1 Histidine kinase [Reichenbachiella agariperforans]
MTNWFYLTLFVTFVSCSHHKTVENTAQVSDLPTHYNNKLKTGLEHDSLQYFALQLSSIIEMDIPDSLKRQYRYVQFRYLYRLGEVDSAIHELRRATDYAEEPHLSERSAFYYRALMNAYYLQNDFLNGLGTAEKMISMLGEQDYKSKALAYNYIQRVYTSMEKHDQSLSANALAYDMFEQAHDTANMMVSKISRASIYFGQQDLDLALNTLSEINIDLTQLSPNINYQYYGNLGAIQFENHLYSDALQTFHKAAYYIDLLPANVKTSALINNYLNLSHAYYELDQLDLSSLYIDSVFWYGIDDAHYQNQKEALKKRLEIAIRKGESPQQVSSQLDSIFSYQEGNYENRINSELIELKNSFAKEKELEAAKRIVEIENISFQRNQYLLLTLLLGAILATTLIVFYYRQRRFRMEKQNFLLHQRLLRSQMNPHFAFNSLNLIKSEINKNAEVSSRYIVKFSRILRALFENSTKDYVLIEDEVQLLEDYLDMQQFRFADRFEYEIINDIPEDAEITIPPMLLQPFVENAIAHAFKEIEEKGMISVMLTLEEQSVQCTIEDNGHGFDIKALRPDSSVQLIDTFLRKMTGHGVSILNKQEGNPDDHGTIIKLKIPFKLLTA